MSSTVVNAKSAGAMMAFVLREDASRAWSQFVSRPGTAYARHRSDVPARWRALWDTVQRRHPLERLVMELGRGPRAQELAYNSGASPAHWGESPHNWRDGLGCLGVDFYLVVGGKLDHIPDLDVIARDLGFRSGRSFRKPDPPHVEVHPWPVLLLKTLRAHALSVY